MDHKTRDRLRRELRRNPDAIADLLDDSQADQDDMLESYDVARRAWGGWPAVDEALRYPSNSVPAYPARAIVPDPERYPSISWRLRSMMIEPPEGGSATFQQALAFSDNCSILAISGGAMITVEDAGVYGQEALSQILIQFQRDTSDFLVAGSQVYADSVVGSGERPYYLGTPGWAFGQNQSLIVSGEANGPTGWRVCLVFHTLESRPWTDLGMSAYHRGR